MICKSTLQIAANTAKPAKKAGGDVISSLHNMGGLENSDEQNKKSHSVYHHGGGNCSEGEVRGLDETRSGVRLASQGPCPFSLR